MSWSGPSRIALAAGGTAGHVYPAIAIAEGLLARGAAEVFFIGTAHGLEREIVPRAGFSLELVRGLPWQHASVAGRARALAAVVPGFFDARGILRRRGAELVIGFGGYASVGAILAGRSLGLRTALVEPNAEVGLANRLLLTSVSRLYTAAGTRVPARLEGRTCRCGVPVRASIVSLSSRKYELQPDVPRRVLVLADPAHSDFLDARIPELLAKIAADGVPIAVRHQTTAAAIATVRQRYGGVPAIVTPFIDDITVAYAAADLVIARAGAGTLAELATCGIPSLLVPLPRSAEGHQRENARVYGAEGAAIVMDEENWDVDVIGVAVAGLLLDTHAWQRMSERARRCADGRAAERLLDDVNSRFSNV